MTRPSPLFTTLLLAIAALKLGDGTPVIALTLRYDRIDNFWFCLLHELAHVGQQGNRGARVQRKLSVDEKASDDPKTAAATIASPSVCSDCRSTAAVSVNTSASLLPVPMTTTSVTAGRPSVTVPVLSRTIVSSEPAR